MHAPLHSMTESQPDRRRWFALAVIVTAQFMVVLDVAIVNVALPTIKTDLDFSQESLQWVVTAYSIMFGGVLLLGGRMADLLGRRRLFMAGLSALHRQLAARRPRLVGGLADRLPRAPGARRRAALPGRAVDPHDDVPRGPERNLALGIWGAVSGSGGAAGVLLGGALTSSLDWSWIFFINVPVGAVVLALTPRLVRESRRRRDPSPLRRAGRRLDHRRADAARVRDDPRRPARLGHDRDDRAAGGLGRADRRPSSPSSCARRRRCCRCGCSACARCSGSNLAGLLLGAAVFSQFFLLTLYMQQVLGYSALETGVAYVALTLTIIVFANVSQTLALRVGIRPRAAARAGARRAAALRALRAAAGRRALLLGSVPGVPDQRARAGVRLHPDDDRRARGRPPRRRRRRLGADQHQPADRRGDRRGRGHHDRRDLDEPLPRPRIRARAGGRRRADPRLHVAFLVLAAVAAAAAIGSALLVESKARLAEAGIGAEVVPQVA